MSNSALRDLHHDYRRKIEMRAVDSENGDMIVEGTAVIFDHEYKLFDFGEKEVYEIIEKGAFNNAEMTDVPLKYNHGDSKGTPARTTSRTEKGKLSIVVTDTGVHMRANLLDTTGGTDLYKEIQAGTVPQMSWAFTIAKDGDSYEENKERITIHVRAVERVFDVSAVDFGANPETSIYARTLSDLDERAKKLDELERAKVIEHIRNLLES